jgi:hypothetical protein
MVGSIERTKPLSTYRNSDLAFWGRLAFAGHYEGFQIIDIGDPSNPERVVDYTCPGSQHDVSVWQNQIWDVSDPENPETIGRVLNPNVEFWHSATFSQDRRRVIFGDEAGGGTGPACRSIDPATRGALWFYDVRAIDSLEDEVVEPRSSWKVPRIQEKLTPEQAQDPNCTMHNFNTLPTTKHDVVVASAHAAGTTMVDFGNASEPREVGHLDPHGANTWSAYWYSGNVYTNDGRRGVDIMQVDDPATQGARKLPFSNPQTMMRSLR